MAVIASVGVGNIGARLALRFAAADHQVIAYDPDSSYVRRLTDHGVVFTDTLADAVAGADYVITSLPNPAVAEDVYLSEDGILSAAAPNAIIVDTSTIGPQAARRLSAGASAAELRFLDSPITGGTTGAENGELTLFVGGDESTLTSARPVLELVASTILHVGEAGVGQAVKLVNNVIVNANLTIAAEALIAGVHLGVPLKTLHSVLVQGSANSFALERYLPRAFEDTRETTFSLDLAVKDIALFLDSASAAFAPTLVSATVASVLRLGQVRGLGSHDLTAVLELFSDLAGDAPGELI